MDVYLSPQQPRWRPTSQTDLQAAIDSGLFDETHRLEAKKLVEPGKGANRELARDLASFAVDGGTIIIGIDEDKTAGTFSLAPQPLQGLTERVESVAYTIPDPPLSLVVDSIPSGAGDGTGYLLVHVPASPSAPHMVDGRYLGRGEKQKRYLTDPEVARLHALRRRVDLDVRTVIEGEIQRDPFPADGLHAHLFLVAEPTAPRPEMMVSTLDREDWRESVVGLLEKAAAESLGIGDFSPGLRDAHDLHRRAGGVAACAYGLTAARTPNPDASNAEVYALDIEFLHDGGLRIFMGRLSDTMRRHSMDTAREVVFEVAAVRFVRHLIKLVTLVADTTGYLGSWGLGFAAVGLRGSPSHTTANNWMASHEGSAYDRDDEIRVTVATYPELQQHPGHVTDRLVGRFLRTYGLRHRYDALLSDPDVTESDVAGS